MEEKRNVPKLRFPGFTDPWEQRKLGEMFIESEDRSSDLEILSVSVVSGIYPASESDRETNPGASLSSYKIVRKGDVVYNSMRMRQGAVDSSRYDGIVSPAYVVARPTAMAIPRFFARLLKRPELLRQYQRLSQGNSKDTQVLKFDEFAGIQVRVPLLLEEQEAIGAIADALDSLIALHQRKLDHVKELKKGLLQKMFPKEGANVPELRFPGFTDPWEQRRLGEIGSVAMCKRVYKDQTTEAGDVPFFKIGTFGGEPDAFISNELFEKYRELYSFPKVGDILISAAGTIGRTIVYQGERAYYQDSNIVWLNHDERLDNSFFLQYLNNQTWSSLEGSTLKRLYNKDILDANIALPKPDEQHRIGALFRKLDSLIALHQRELDHVKELKKGLLQQMFV